MVEGLYRLARFFCFFEILLQIESIQLISVEKTSALKKRYFYTYTIYTA